MVMTYALINFSLSPHLLRVMCVLMQVHVLVGVNVSVIMCILVWICVHVCVAPPIVVGAWPMAGTLWRLYYYKYLRETRSVCTDLGPQTAAEWRALE